MANRLASATSPYLIQHADNPVDWYEWGPEALARAAAEDKPLLVSIGYAACHWCHVMAHESFEDAAIARGMNERFVCIKIDREERPDLDAIYMTAVQAMSGHGGWPMTVFCTPDGRPFWGGTYFPPEPAHGMPSFPQVLDAIHEAWTTKREGILAQSDELTEHIGRTARIAASADPLSEEILTTAARGMLQHADTEWGGFGGAPKFPQTPVLEFLLRMHVRGNPDALPALTLTLDKMARGGIFDHVGGGFHRYAVDRIWLVPHFEKMLYDNAQLLRAYTHAWQVTGSALYRETALRTAAYLLREMQQAEGGFSSSQDADSEGVEGKFTVWPYDELVALAGDDAPIAVAAFAASRAGNWEGVNVPWRPEADDKVAADLGTSVDEVRAGVKRVRAALFEARERRARPTTDDKVVTSWNGLTIAALAEAGRAFGRPELVEAAARAAGFVLSALRRDDGRLLRAWRAGRTSGPAFLDDHAMLADGLLTLYEATFDRRWWDEALRVATEMRRLFADTDNGGFFDTGSDTDDAILRPKELIDNAVASGNSAASDVLLRIRALTGDGDWEHAATGSLRLVRPLLERAPLGFGHALSALDRYLAPSLEVALIGEPEAARALLDAAEPPYLPNMVVAGGEAGSTEPALLRDRPALDGKPAAYVCRDFACDAPVSDPRALAERLAAGANT